MVCSTLGRNLPTLPQVAKQMRFRLALDMSVFFNLFNEAEPFAAILIAHRTHVLGRRLRVGEEFLERGQTAPSPPARWSGGAL